ncbi:MAG: TrkH family potassium uptake protein [Candidatus Aenigmarchaeota archaeon]|nr:TrkH family potassium uptake protein [Candidatus Aenigmarchaeota archaeon]
MNLKAVFRDIGIVLKYISPVFLLPVVAALIYGEYFTIVYFVLTFLPMFVIGSIFEKVFATDEKTLLKEGLLTVALLWLMITLAATIPYICIEKITLLEASFETMAAWTTTGFSLLVPEDLTHTMLFYRSVQQWFGGVGIVVLALAGMFRTGASLYYAEARTEKVRPNILNTIKMIWWIYALYTIVGIVLLVFAGMTPFDAINHGMTSIATAGLSTHSESIGYYNNPYIEFVIIILMITGSISFLSHYELLLGKTKKFFSDVFVRSLFVFIIVGTLFVMKDKGSRSGLFTVVSAVSSTGYNLDTVGMWPDFSIFVLIVLMLVGGCAGSTVSGIKINRIIIVVKSVFWSVNRLKSQSRVFSRKIGPVSYNDTLVCEVFKFILLYFVFIMLGAFVFLHEGYELKVSVFQSVSAIGNSGLSVMPEYTPLSMFTAIMLMWIGRLEIWAVITLFGYLMIKSKLR